MSDLRRTMWRRKPPPRSVKPSAWQNLRKVSANAKQNNEAVIEALERKVAYMGLYHRNFANVEMAML